MVQRLPDTTLQSLTGSAFAYLQRVDTALGGPVDLARLLPQLGLALPTTSTPGRPRRSEPRHRPDLAALDRRGQSDRFDSDVCADAPDPHQRACSSAELDSHGAVPAVAPDRRHGEHRWSPGPVGGAVGSTTGAVGGAANGATKTVDGVLEGVTGNGPSLPLPTTVPSVPALPGLHR